jgi:hypothetical protein
MRITSSTADAVLQALWPNTADLLKRFEEVKKTANVADGERDRLREYIQKNVPPGKYDNVILVIDNTAAQIYPNADGKFALKSYSIVAPESKKPEAGIEVVMLAISVTGAQQLIDALLHQLQKGKDELRSYVEERLICIGVTADNDLLYMEKGGKKITITVIPEAEDGATGAD